MRGEWEVIWTYDGNRKWFRTRAEAQAFIDSLPKDEYYNIQISRFTGGKQFLYPVEYKEEPPMMHSLKSEYYVLHWFEFSELTLETRTILVYSYDKMLSKKRELETQGFKVKVKCYQEYEMLE